MTQPDKSYSRALTAAEHVRVDWIGLTHELPDGTPQELIRQWNVADNELVAFLRELRRLVD